MNFDTLLEKIELQVFDQEFEYLHKTIEILISNYQKDFQHEDEKYKQAILELKETGEYDEPLDKEHAPEVSYGQMMEYNLMEPFYELESFSNIIIEALIVKHLSYIEDILIKMSFMVQKKENQIIPPNHNISGAFTDMLKAVEYIELITNKTIRIKDLPDWKIITLLRTLRHQLAHGKRRFVLKEGDIDDINRVIPIINTEMIAKNFDPSQGLAYYAVGSNQPSKNPKNEWHCSIGSDINVLKQINQICVHFVEDVKRVYTNKYSASA